MVRIMVKIGVFAAVAVGLAYAEQWFFQTYLAEEQVTQAVRQFDHPEAQGNLVLLNGNLLHVGVAFVIGLLFFLLFSSEFRRKNENLAH